MKTGDTVVCKYRDGYDLRIGKEYVVLGYKPRSAPASEAGFVFPAYVRVQDESGREVWCHACRFSEKVAP